MNWKTFIMIVVSISTITFLITFGIALKYVHENKENFSVEIQPSAVITPEELYELLEKENR